MSKEKMEIVYVEFVKPNGLVGSLYRVDSEFSHCAHQQFIDAEVRDGRVLLTHPRREEGGTRYVLDIPYDNCVITHNIVEAE